MIYFKGTPHHCARGNWGAVMVEILLYAQDSRIGDRGLAHRTDFLCTNTEFKQYSHLLSLSISAGEVYWHFRRCWVGVRALL
jgi:hypothetical protein